MKKQLTVAVIVGDLPGDPESICMRMYGMNIDSLVEEIRTNKDGKYNAFHGKEVIANEK